MGLDAAALNFVRTALSAWTPESFVPKDLAKAFKYFNRKYFNNELPPSTDLRWEPLKECMGYCTVDEIALDLGIRKWGAIWKFTLLHEMCHLKCGQKAAHGPKWQAEMLRLATAGAFKGLW